MERAGGNEGAAGAGAHGRVSVSITLLPGPGATRALWFPLSSCRVGFVLEFICKEAFGSSWLLPSAS